MIKAKVIVPFYEKRGSELYLDEERFNELLKLGKVEKVENSSKKLKQEITTASIDKDGKRRVLSEQSMEIR